MVLSQHHLSKDQALCLTCNQESTAGTMTLLVSTSCQFGWISHACHFKSSALLAHASSVAFHNCTNPDAFIIAAMSICACSGVNLCFFGLCARSSAQPCVLSKDSMFHAHDCIQKQHLSLIMAWSYVSLQIGNWFFLCLMLRSLCWAKLTHTSWLVPE